MPEGQGAGSLAVLPMFPLAPCGERVPEGRVRGSLAVQ
jgi:hypothetical protein